MSVGLYWLIVFTFFLYPYWFSVYLFYQLLRGGLLKSPIIILDFSMSPFRYIIYILWFIYFEVLLWDTYTFGIYVFLKNCHFYHYKISLSSPSNSPLGVNFGINVVTWFSYKLCLPDTPFYVISLFKCFSCEQYIVGPLNILSILRINVF